MWDITGKLDGKMIKKRSFELDGLWESQSYGPEVWNLDGFWLDGVEMEKKIASEKLVTDHYVSGYTCIK